MQDIGSHLLGDNQNPVFLNDFLRVSVVQMLFWDTVPTLQRGNDKTYLARDITPLLPDESPPNTNFPRYAPLL